MEQPVKTSLEFELGSIAALSDVSSNVLRASTVLGRWPHV